jgi:hypothetical protein
MLKGVYLFWFSKTNIKYMKQNLKNKNKKEKEKRI